ncbi:hypothetical protein PFISCL1PPCAC_6682 [Pristionchus fissidentatus]|uniref:Uncharacterized protein n=1 Tax=Pristionchus fissidentatus TaxID=1538716 RepID=A0AAV5V9Z9_9BILA|nr:hypothetical protein PFISCL1PPCAC_6682 [Pristionchus fissidentatus]
MSISAKRQLKNEPDPDFDENEIVGKLNKLHETNFTLTRQVNAMKGASNANLAPSAKGAKTCLDACMEENEKLKKEMGLIKKRENGGGQLSLQKRSSSALEETKASCSSLREELDRMKEKMKDNEASNERTKAEIERMQWMNKMLSEQVETWKKSAEM